MTDEEIVFEKKFSELNKEEQKAAVRKHFEKLHNYIVCYETEGEFIDDYIKEKAELLGLEEITYEVDGYNRVRIENVVLTREISHSIDKMIEFEKGEEKPNQETIEMLGKMKEKYTLMEGIVGDSEAFELALNGERVYIEESLEYIETENLMDDEEIKERLKLLIKHTQNKENRKMLKKFRIQMEFNSEFEVDVMDAYVEMLLTELCEEGCKPLIEYVEGKLDEIKNILTKNYNYLQSDECIVEYLEQFDNVLFTEEGVEFL